VGRPLTTVHGGLVRVVVAGVLAGALAGLFGVGGGILIVPALVLFVHLPQRLAHGTSLAAIVPIALTGLLGYALDGKVDWAVAFFLAVGSAAIGAFVGTHLLHVVKTRSLVLGFAVVMIVTAVRLVADHSEATGRSALTFGLVLVLVGVGIVSGILAGLLGVGGGVILIPAMVVLFGLPTAVAKGTSLAVILPTAVVGTARNLRNGNADLRVAGAVGVAGMVAAFAAAQLAVGMDERLSNVTFAVLLVVVAVQMLVRELRRPDEPSIEPPGEA
jgi:uncharacterized membrane protein YfcA